MKPEVTVAGGALGVGIPITKVKSDPRSIEERIAANKAADAEAYELAGTMNMNSYDRNRSLTGTFRLATEQLALARYLRGEDEDWLSIEGKTTKLRADYSAPRKQ